MGTADILINTRWPYAAAFLSQGKGALYTQKHSLYTAPRWLYEGQISCCAHESLILVQCLGDHSWHPVTLLVVFSESHPPTKQETSHMSPTVFLFLCFMRWIPVQTSKTLCPFSMLDGELIYEKRLLHNLVTRSWAVLGKASHDIYKNDLSKTISSNGYGLFVPRIQSQTEIIIHKWDLVYPINMHRGCFSVPCSKCSATVRHGKWPILLLFVLALVLAWKYAGYCYNYLKPENK